MVITSIIKNKDPSNKGNKNKTKVTICSPIDFTQEEDSGYNSDDPESSQSGCEIALFDGQICDVPYDLFDLPDLREILSLDVWNSYLTEDERLILAAHLPDMDQHEFSLAVKQLLSGEPVFFGNPLDVLFYRLKGGFYAPEVVRARELLLVLQRRAYYHSLKLYQDRMIEKFSDMERMWSGVDPTVGIQERVKLWNRKKCQKPVVLVDLNAFPIEEEPSPPPRLANDKICINETINPPNVGSSYETFELNARKKAKGILKVNQKELKENLLEKRILLRSPKGVLKIKSKSNNYNISPIVPDLCGKITVDFLGSYSQDAWYQSPESNARFIRSPVDVISSNNRASEIGERVYEKNFLENFGRSESLVPEKNQGFTELPDLNLAKFSESKPNLPITYKRKKAQRKLELVPSIIANRSETVEMKPRRV